jgi:uncharacterized tellurite resistance protein B-like protein
MELIIILVPLVIVIVLIVSSAAPKLDEIDNQTNPTTPKQSKAKNQKESKRKLDRDFEILRTGSMNYNGSSRVYLSFKIEDFKATTRNFRGIAVYFGGTINGLGQTDVRFRLDIFDEELENHECKGLILTELESLNAGGRGVFRFESNNSTVPYNSASLNERQLVFIPFDLVDFPKSGNRKFKCEFKLMDGNLRMFPYGSTTTTFELFIPTDGYLDKLEKRDNSYKHLINLALLVAQSDGRIAMKEMSTIEKWINEKFSSDNEKKEKYLDHARDMKEKLKIDGLYLDTNKEIRKFSNEASKKIIYEGLDLLVRIMSADLSHDTNEKQIIQEFIDHNSIPKEEYQKIYNKHIDASMIENEITEVELGITPNMTLLEKKKVLRDQYQLWSKKITSSDEKVRRNAESMIEKIAKERAKLD